MSSVTLRNTPRNLRARLTALPGKNLPADYSKAVRLLKRPYYRLSAEDLAYVKSIAGDSDVLLLDDKQVTWGDADGVHALMPLGTPI